MSNVFSQIHLAIFRAIVFKYQNYVSISFVKKGDMYDPDCKFIKGLQNYCILIHLP